MTEILLQKLILYIAGNKSRIKCLSAMIISLIAGNSIYLKGLSLGIKNNTKASSKIHRVYRFLKDFKFNYLQVAKFILSIFDDKHYIYVMDRTNWEFGKSNINILFLSIVIGKMSVPIYWKALPHSGSCSSEFMLGFLAEFIKNFGTDKIKHLLADREFMNQEWLEFLVKNEIDFIIPAKSNYKIRIENSLKTYAISKTFKDLKALEYKSYKGILWNKKVTFSAYKNDKSELMILISTLPIMIDIFAIYKYRWSIERLFKHLKTGGFDIEKSHLVHPERFRKLLVVTSIAAALIVKNGLIENTLKPIPIKRYKSVEKQLFSLFTYGFDHIKATLSNSITFAKRLLRSIFYAKPPPLVLLQTPIHKNL